MQQLDLGGEWEYLADPEGVHTPETLPAQGWRAMRLPNNWQLGGLHNYNGVVWFRRSFAVDALAAGARYALRFEGVDYFADVWLNRVHLGHHEGYFQPFELRAEAALVTGDNALLVRVDAPREQPGSEWPSHKRLIKGIFNQHDCRPGASDPERGQDLCTGGIWNGLALLELDDVRVVSAQVTPQLLGHGPATLVLALAVELARAKPAHAKLRVTITPANFTDEDQRFVIDRELTLQPGLNEVTLAQTIERPRLWWTWDHGAPDMYQFAATVLLDDASSAEAGGRFGIREVRIGDDWAWHLNGRRVFVRGTNIIPTQWLAEYSPEMIAGDIALLRDCNINGVRVHAHVQRREFYAACDEAGILVWADFALQWSYRADDRFIANAVAQARDWVRLLYNHPSIVVWCCHNEPTGNRYTLDPLLEQAVRSEDASRHVVASSAFDQHVYPGWYGGSAEQFHALPGAPFVNEWGAQALPNIETLREMFGPDDLWPTTPEQWQRWAYHDFQYDQTFNVAGVERGASIEEFVANSQRYQARLLKRSVERYRQAKYAPMQSLFQFMFVECWPSITWAVVDYRRRPKAGYYALRKAYQPVLIGLGGGTNRRTRLEIGSLWSILSFGDVFIVNDLPRAFPGAQLRIALRVGGQQQTLFEYPVDLPADTVVHPLRLFAMMDAPPDAEPLSLHLLAPAMQLLSQLAPGVYRADLELYDAEGALLSANDEELTFVSQVVPAPLPF